MTTTNTCYVDLNGCLEGFPLPGDAFDMRLTLIVAPWYFYLTIYTKYFDTKSFKFDPIKYESMMVLRSKHRKLMRTLRNKSLMRGSAEHETNNLLTLLGLPWALRPSINIFLTHHHVGKQ